MLQPLSLLLLSLGLLSWCWSDNLCFSWLLVVVGVLRSCCVCTCCCLVLKCVVFVLYSFLAVLFVLLLMFSCGCIVSMLYFCCVLSYWIGPVHFMFVVFVLALGIVVVTLIVVSTFVVIVIQVVTANTLDHNV